ncbi:hypothetical protein CC86DRAFT_372119 [Ophiobolus disseminans]|uniref:UBA domain-containing protein n=1 Tax=Ophiobolus disseminans TaxID=1469910 RepID=A0A6A6ZU39_9PLEO|nr:hypothetical protein CC86DRAFT_372119 [Ophiobolus disseminans]
MATDDQISLLLDFIGYQLGKDEAIQLLKISNNNVETAASKFWDTDASNLKKLLNDSVANWDDTAFASGRYGQDETSGGIPTFNIDYAQGLEHYPHSNNPSRAPTRPPSRTSQHSAVSTHIGDAPMQSIEHMQESGVIGNSEPVFGPATKDHYDTAQWAMVPTSTEVIPDAIPSARKRDVGQPAILKPSPRFNYLPALVAILHSVPLFRNALLAPTVTQRSYWMGDDWWKGSPAIPASIIDTIAGVKEAHELDIIHETQRLMAFLDTSDRAYATVSSMLELDAWKQSTPALEDEDDDLLKFLLIWSDAYEAQVPNAELDGWLRSVVNVGDSYKKFFVLDASVVREGSTSDCSLYDVLDDSIFSSATGSAHITNVGKVLTLRLNSATTNAQGLGCRIPATLYPDRYLEANKPVIDSMFRDMKQYEDQARDIDIATQKLKFHTPKKEKSKPIETLKLVETTMKAYKTQEGEDLADPKDAAILSQLQTLYNSIESKLAALDEQTKKVKAAIKDITGRFKPVIDDGSETLIDLTAPEYPEGQSPEDAMHHPYHLCGVATHLGVVYLLHPDTKSNIPGAQQWWRVQYDTETSSPTIRRDPVTQQDVLERAATESASALLVYAHADAMSVEPIPLSKPLLDFVKKDGLNFMEELQQSATGWEDMTYDSINDVPQGGWNLDPPDYQADWASMSAQDFHKHNQQGSNLSSATLTPNTEHDGVQEMVEVNGGMDALTGISRASSSTIEGDVMDLDAAEHDRANHLHSDAVMLDNGDDDGPRVQHIEVAEKKGG